MTATVTYLPGVTPPDRLGERRAAEIARREATRCPDPGCRQFKPNHTWECAERASGPEGDAA